MTWPTEEEFNQAAIEDRSIPLGNNASIHPNHTQTLLQPLLDRITVLEQKAFEHDQMRATLLVNFLEGSPHNKFGFSIKEHPRTNIMLFQVLEQLTKK